MAGASADSLSSGRLESNVNKNPLRADILLRELYQSILKADILQRNCAILWDNKFSNLASQHVGSWKAGFEVAWVELDHRKARSIEGKYGQSLKIQD